jgi:hypothetical protein
VHNLRRRRRERIATGTVRIQLACNSMCWLEGYSPLTTKKRGEKKKKDKRGRRRRNRTYTYTNETNNHTQTV